MPVGSGGSSGSGQPAPPPPLSPAEQNLKQLLSALRKGESTLSPEVQGLMDNMSAKNSNAEIKSLKSAADKLGAARKTLQQTRASRLQMFDAWKKFVDAGVERWQGFAATFRQQEGAMEVQIATALEDLKAAKSQLNASKAKATGTEVTDGGEISDEDFMAVDPVASLRTSMDGFVVSLATLREQAAESLEQEIKRQKKLDDRQTKLEAGEGQLSMPAGLSLTSPTLMPFQQAGQ